MNYTELLQHYLDGLDPNIDLHQEAIATLENYFQYIDQDTLLHHSRPLAIAYLALTVELLDADHRKQRGRTAPNRA